MVDLNPTTRPIPTPQPGADPAKQGWAAGLGSAIGVALVMVAAKYGLDLDPVVAATIGAGLIAVVSPAVTALIARLRAWDPRTVAKLQSDLQALAQEAQGENPPAVVTGPALSIPEASTAHPGVLGLSGPGDMPDQGVAQHRARHERP